MKKEWQYFIYIRFINGPINLHIMLSVCCNLHSVGFNFSVLKNQPFLMDESGGKNKTSDLDENSRLHKRRLEPMCWGVHHP